MSIPLAGRAGTATDAFAITPSADPLPRAPTLGIYVPAGVTTTSLVVRFYAGGPLISFPVSGPGILPVCPTHVTTGPAGLVGLT